jgi:hypothetical protein
MKTIELALFCQQAALEHSADRLYQSRVRFLDVNAVEFLPKCIADAFRVASRTFLQHWQI